jgi:hypothetical protein
VSKSPETSKVTSTPARVDAPQTARSPAPA